MFSWGMCMFANLFYFLLYVVSCTVLVVVVGAREILEVTDSLLNFSVNISVVGYAFIYFEDERDAEDAIRRLDNVSFGYNRRRLSVEWSRVISCLYLVGIFFAF